MNKKKMVMWFAACFIGLAAFFMTGKVTEAVTIVLDAGHDDTHTGARGNNLKEEYLNLQIALSCKTELEKYEGVTVYMVRDVGTCPYGGASVGSSTACNGKRVDFAASVGADVYISLHNNSSTNTSARGVSVYYPTTNYQYGCGITGQGLAQSILNQLVACGLENRGISVRYSEDNTRYPDGSLADYYGVIRRSKLKGIPAIIVEHAFISNYYDALQFLGSNDKLWKLGQLDAEAIAGFYGLKKKAQLNYTNASLTVSGQNKNTEFKAQISNVYNAGSVQFAVWSDAGGQDDLIWYPAVLDGSGNWSASIPVWKHGTEGKYQVHAYVNNSIFMRSATFSVQGPSVSAMNLLDVNREEGSFTVQLQGASSGTELVEVTAGIWHKSDQSDLRWVALNRNADGTYSCKVQISQYGYEYGTYQVHAYIRDWNGIKKCVGTRTLELEPSETIVQCSRSAVPWIVNLQAEHVPYGSEVEAVDYVFRGLDGSEALRISSTKYHEKWSAEANTAQLGGAGTYQLKTYGRLKDGRNILLDEQEYSLEELPQADEIVTGAGMSVWDYGVVRVEMEKRTDVRLCVNPWCDYESIRSALSREKRYTCLLAYDLSWQTVPEAVATGDAVTIATPEAVISFLVPDCMKQAQLQVLYGTGASGAALTPVDYTWSDDGTAVIVKQQPEGMFVLAAFEERRKGDADEDGSVTLSDAQMVLRAALQIEPLASEVIPYCDVNGDGQVTLIDAQKILKAALKIENLD